MIPELLKLCCKIMLGKFELTYVSEVSIDSDVENLTDTCSITLPRALYFEGEPLRNHLKRGDAVKVELGYNDDLKTVFTGFIKSLKMNTPLVVECEDNMFVLKKVIVKPTHYAKVSIKKLLDDLLPEDIERSVLDFDLGEFTIKDETNLSKILEYIVSTYKIRFFFKQGKFYATMPHTQVFVEGDSTQHIFEFQKNIISDSINYQYKDDINVTIVAKSIQRDNKTIEVRVPEGGKSEIRTFYYNNRSKAELQKLATDMLKFYAYDGLNGSFDAFGIPFVQVSDFVKLFDSKNAERNGQIYLVKSVKYNFGQNGYRQTIELSYKL